MELMTSIDLKKLPFPITYSDSILLVGSCFTEHIGNALHASKFSVMQNPNGILFDPASVCRSLESYIDDRPIREAELFQLDEVWHSWQHHSRFSDVDASKAVHAINDSRQKAHEFLSRADWIIITLGSSFSYRLVHSAAGGSPEGIPVANCHRAPARWFVKHLMEIHEIVSLLDRCYHRLMQFNPKLNILFTVSPVRHLRDGVVDNNRSKARLIESVHHLVNKFERLHYFPAYELVIDVLRDYRFYDIDLAHPNYSATEFVLEKFSEACIDPGARQLMQELRKIKIARNHRAFQPSTQAHRKFLMDQLEKVKALKRDHPFLDLADEIEYFSRC